MDERQQESTFVIHDNVLQNKRILGFRKRNLIEGIIFSVIFGGVICMIPFVFKVKSIILICCSVFIIIFSATGINNQSITEFVYNWLRTKKSKGTMSLRSIDHAKRRSIIQNTSKNQNSIYGESYADQILRIIKEKIAEYQEKHSQNQ